MQEIQAGKDPLYKIEIENHAKNLNVEVEWKVPSHFEAQLASEKNDALAKYFFSRDKSIYNLG